MPEVFDFTIGLSTLDLTGCRVQELEKDAALLAKGRYTGDQPIFCKVHPLRVNHNSARDLCAFIGRYPRLVSIELVIDQWIEAAEDEAHCQAVILQLFQTVCASIDAGFPTEKVLVLTRNDSPLTGFNSVERLLTATFFFIDTIQMGDLTLDEEEQEWRSDLSGFVQSEGKSTPTKFHCRMDFALTLLTRFTGRIEQLYVHVDSESLELEDIAFLLQLVVLRQEHLDHLVYESRGRVHAEFEIAPCCLEWIASQRITTLHLKGWCLGTDPVALLDQADESLNHLTLENVHFGDHAKDVLRNLAGLESLRVEQCLDHSASPDDALDLRALLERNAHLTKLTLLGTASDPYPLFAGQVPRCLREFDSLREIGLGPYFSRALVADLMGIVPQKYNLQTLQVPCEDLSSRLALAYWLQSHRWGLWPDTPRAELPVELWPEIVATLIEPMDASHDGDAEDATSVDPSRLPEGLSADEKMGVQASFVFGVLRRNCGQVVLPASECGGRKRSATTVSE